MGRYLVFSWWRHYPSGGMNDFCGAFADVETAIDRAMARHLPEEENWSASEPDDLVSEANVVDATTLTVVFAAHYNPYSDDEPWVELGRLDESVRDAFAAKYDGKYVQLVNDAGEFVNDYGERL